MKDLDLYVAADGTIEGIYADELVDLFAGEESTTRRASHVEPDPRGGWTADMRPVGGPILGRFRPFKTRTAALAAETKWLHGNYFRGTITQDNVV